MASGAIGEEVETLEGTVTAVIYQNPENGYTVLRVKSKEGSQTVVGELAEVSAGEHILATGIWVDTRPSAPSSRPPPWRPQSPPKSRASTNTWPPV